jgi:hypothetical protein
MQPIFLTSGSPVGSMIIGVVFLVVFIAELLLYRKIKDAGGHKKKIREARERGHVVNAVLTSDTMYLMNEDKSKFSPEYYARYEYVVNGKHYHRVERYTFKPPQSITLYYLDDPGKTFTDQPPADVAVLPLIVIAVLVTIVVKLFLF